MADIDAVFDALAAQIDTELATKIANLQVVAIGPFPNPSPPSIDFYPGDPFMESIGFGIGNKEFYITVRARVCVPDDEAGKRFLLRMMDPESDTSVEQAILAGDRTLGGTVGRVASVEGASAFGIFAESGGQTTRNLLGCIWRVRVIR
jgi:hypothetical protein